MPVLKGTDPRRIEMMIFFSTTRAKYAKLCHILVGMKYT